MIEGSEGAARSNRERISLIVRVLRMMPALSALAVMAGIGAMATITGSCGRSVFATATSTSSATATATGTPGAGAFLYAGNQADGTVSQYKRSQTTGALSAAGTAKAGVARGPVGLTVDPTGTFLYLANPGDGLHQYKINQKTGALAALSSNNGLVKAGNAPQWVALATVGGANFAYATNFNSGSISQYQVESSGKLLSKGSVSSNLLTNPFGAAATGSFLYVSDQGNGSMVSFPINSDGTLNAAQATATASSAQSVRNPVVTLLDPTASFLYVSDMTTGFVSVFLTGGGALPAFAQSVQSTTLGGAVGLAIASIPGGNEYLYVANQTANSISLYIVNSSTGLLTSAGLVFTSLALPTGLAVGTSSAGGAGPFLYVADQNAAEVIQFTINTINGSLSNPVSIASGNGPQFLAIP
ncbi:MAG TPA: beta-propeller fold lactonase family protein [Candidatus Binataceae bacterium]|nr:beta-propeller fold lactonase family protein [Candidatus Binataceae bacterium]